MTSGFIIRSRSGPSLEKTLRLSLVVFCAVPAFVQEAQEVAAEQVDSSDSAAIPWLLHIFVSCNADRAVAHLVDREGSFPEVCTHARTIFYKVANVDSVPR